MAGEGHSNPTRLSPTPDNWRVIAIEDLCENVTSGGTPLRSNSSFYQRGKHSWFKTQELRDSVLFQSDEKITDTALAQTSAKLFPKDTVLMAMYGDGKTITSLGILTEEAATNQACCAMIPDRALCEPRFLFFALRYHRDDFIRIASGGAQRNLSGKLIRRFALNTPPLDEQRAIAHILGTLDDKIELNRRMNKTLEAMARALFKSWFVDFDAVRAKAEGRDPGLPQPLADLFPDSFEDSELGEIPKGWRVGPILEAACLLSGGTPKTDRAEYWGGGIPWASAKDVSQCDDSFLVETERKITERGLKESATQLIPALCSAVVARGATTGRMVMLGETMAMNQTCYALETSAGTPFALYCQLRQEIDHLVHAAHGSVFDTITTSTFATSKVVLPPRPLLREFELRVDSLFKRVLAGIKASRVLASLRDTLLPKLISGDLRVKDAERLVEIV